MPPPFSRTINLEWIQQGRGSMLGVSSYCLGDDGAVSQLRIESEASRDYFVETVSAAAASNNAPGTGPQTRRTIEFQSNSITHAACQADGRSLYATSSGELYFLWIDNQGNPASLALPIRQGDRFLGLQTSGADDARRTAAILTLDAAGYHTVTLVESPEPGAQGGALRVSWNKAWPDAIAAFALSHDGAYFAVATVAGVVALLDRSRTPVWTANVGEGSIIAAMAVAATGDVALIDQRGSIRVCSAAAGTIQWELNMPVGESVLPDAMAAGLICSDAEMQLTLCALNRMDAFGELEAVYLLLDGRSGDLLWEASVTSPINGVSIAPDGGFGAISCEDGSTTLLSFAGRADALSSVDGILQERVRQLAAEAKSAYKDDDAEAAVRLLHEAFDINPGLCVGIGFYDDAVWIARQRALAETKTVSAQSLARIETALALLPNDERLTVRRNALARLLAESIAREAGAYLAESRVEEAIAKYVEALTIDRTLQDVRASLLVATDQLTLTLLKQADVAFYEERFAEAIQLLERVAALRPGEESIGRRLELAQGLQAYATAMQMYVGKQYQEAVFWFRKALSLLPDHVESAKFLAYAESLLRSDNELQKPAAAAMPEPTLPSRAPQAGFHPRSKSSDKPAPLPR